ncbi:MAG: hypothetical protein AAF191_10370 [Verrucomicrobiota bacterium]
MNAYLKLVLFLVLVIAFFVTGHFDESSRPDGKKISPFTEVMFENETILVEYESAKYELVSIAHVTSPTLVSSARKHFGRQWQKRIREDITDVLSAAGVSPKRFVPLTLKDRETGTIKEIPHAEMTEENRRKIYNRSSDGGSGDRSTLIPNP